MTEFEKAVVEEVKRVRAKLQDNTDLHRFQFQILADGRVHDGDIQISFGIGEYSASVNGNSIEAVISEYFRRKGFERRHSGLVLTGPGTVENSDDIPF